MACEGVGTGRKAYVDMFLLWSDRLFALGKYGYRACEPAQLDLYNLDAELM